MPHTITYDSALQILEVKIHGEYFLGESKQLMLETLERSRNMTVIESLLRYEMPN